jgi:hypothetical protein
MTTEPTRKPRTFLGRGPCSECSTELTLISGGLVIAHGPKDARCPGGGRPPKAADALPLLSAPTPDAEPTAAPVEAVEPTEAPDHLPPSAYRAGDRVERPSHGWFGIVEQVGAHHLTGETVVTVGWDHGPATTHGINSIAQIRRVESAAETVAEVADSLPAEVALPPRYAPTPVSPAAEVATAPVADEGVIVRPAEPSPSHRAIGEAEEAPAPSLTLMAEMSAELTEARAELAILRRAAAAEADLTDSATREAQALRARNSDLRDALRHATALIGLIGRPS